MELTSKEFKLLQLLSDGKFYSGQQLAEKMGVSRTSIWNYIKNIETHGIDLHAVKGKGTRLAKPIELLDHQLILNHLHTESAACLHELVVFNSIPSTNKYLLEKNQSQQLANGTVCLAEMQTAGKGRLGRDWVSPFSKNIYMSIAWSFKSGIGAISGLSLACGVAVCRALTQVGLKGHGLKWPNDILVDERKLAGILVEIQGESQNEVTAVVGVGLNCGMTNEEGQQISQPWIDMESAMLEQPFSRNELVSEMLNELLVVLNAFEFSGLSPLLNEWDVYDVQNGRCVEIISGDEKRSGTAHGITVDGQLKLKTEQGTIELISSGEVSLRLQAE